MQRERDWGREENRVDSSLHSIQLICNSRTWTDEQRFREGEWGNLPEEGN